MNKKLIFSSIALFLLTSFVFLSWTEKKQADINSKNIWMIYFTNPKDKSLDFVIENHSSSTSFEYKILEDKNVLKQEDINVKTGETKNIPISSSGNGKVTIQVQSSNEKKGIYKIL